MHHAPSLLDLPELLHHDDRTYSLRFIIFAVLFGVALVVLDFYRDVFIISRIVGRN